MAVSYKLEIFLNMSPSYKFERYLNISPSYKLERFLNMSPSYKLERFLNMAPSQELERFVNMSPSYTLREESVCRRKFCGSILPESFCILWEKTFTILRNQKFLREKTFAVHEIYGFQREKTFAVDQNERYFSIFLDTIGAFNGITLFTNGNKLDYYIIINTNISL